MYGKPFEDEFHSRLQFRRRALVACANPDQRDSNGSQFFITLDRADWLTKKHTIFGTVTGDTVYNLMRFNDVEVGPRSFLHPSLPFDGRCRNFPRLCISGW